MKFIADLHIHSKYSRATSPQMNIDSLSTTAEKKGILVMGTGDFTHQEWLNHLKETLQPAEPGLFKNNNTRFLLSSEISCIYSKNGRVRKIHILVFAPDFQTVEKINAHLGALGNLHSDGRPILGLDAKELAKIVLNINPQCLIIPAHAWTPWFSIFGSKSGFDSIQECFEEYTKHIYAIETGLSSDPLMNWRLSALDNITLISNSDAHSPAKIGREANVFDIELSYNSIMEAIKTRKGFLYTIEFFPEEGKYHYDGHRNCNVSASPEQTKKYNGLCPVCSRPLTVGVLNRVEELADREQGFKPDNAIPFKSLIPLQEIVSAVVNKGVNTKTVEQEYDKLIKTFNTEFNILLDVPESELKSGCSPEIAEAILKVRQGKVNVTPGYDGVYGKVNIFEQGEEKAASNQATLF